MKTTNRQFQSILRLGGGFCSPTEGWRTGLMEKLTAPVRQLFTRVSSFQQLQRGKRAANHDWSNHRGKAAERTLPLYFPGGLNPLAENSVRHLAIGMPFGQRHPRKHLPAPFENWSRQGDEALLRSDARRPRRLLFELLGRQRSWKVMAERRPGLLVETLANESLFPQPYYSKRYLEENGLWSNSKLTYLLRKDRKDASYSQAHKVHEVTGNRADFG